MESRIPPNHMEAERAVLGSMMRSGEAVLLAQESLSSEDFYDPANAEIFSAMLAIAALGRPVDLVTLDEELRRRGRLDALGGNPVTAEEAASIVAGKIPGASAADVDIWEESGDGRGRYEGELFLDGMKYEFEIDPQTGRIFDWNADLRD